MAARRRLWKPLHLLSMLPLLVPAGAWWQEAMWFKPAFTSVAVELATFYIVFAVSVHGASYAAMSRISSPRVLGAVAIGLTIATVLVAQQAVLALVASGYSQELNAYTSTVAVAASKRGLLFVLCSASIPVLLALLLRLGQVNAGPRDALP